MLRKENTAATLLNQGFVAYFNVMHMVFKLIAANR